MNKRAGRAYSRLALAGLLVASVMSPAIAAELADPLGGETADGTITDTAAFRVNDNDDDDVAVSRIARDADGNFVVVWENDDAIFGQRYDYNGRRVDDTFRIDDDEGDASQPDVAMEPGGGFAAVWQRDGDIYLRRYGQDGAALDDPQRVNATTAGQQSAPAVALYQETGNANQSDAVVVWQSEGQNQGQNEDQDENANQDSSNGSDIFARVFGGSGAAQQDADVAINGAVDGEQTQPAVDVATSGQFVVAWAGPAPNDTQAILARRFDASAMPQGVEFQVNGTGSGTQSQPSVGVAANGSFTVAWRSADSGSANVRVQRYDGDGVPNGGERAASGNAVANDASPQIAMAATNRAALVWANKDGSIAARLFDTAGAPDGSVRVLADDTDGGQPTPDVASDADGDFAVTWLDDDAVLANRYVGGEPVDLSINIFVNESALLVDDTTAYQIGVSNFHDATTGATDILDINNAIGASQGARASIELPDGVTVDDIDTDNFDCETDRTELNCKASMLLRAGLGGTFNATARITVTANEAGVLRSTGVVTQNQVDPMPENDDGFFNILAEAIRDRNAGTGGSGDGGGCTLVTGQRPVDPLLWLMLVAAVLILRQRSRSRRRYA